LNIIFYESSFSTKNYESTLGNAIELGNVSAKSFIKMLCLNDSECRIIVIT